MKKMFWIGVIIVCQMTAGCHAPTADSSSQNTPIESSVAEVLDAPQTLVIDVEYPENYPEKLFIYDASFFSPDQDAMENVFMHETVIEISDYAEGLGIYYYSENEIYSLDEKYGSATYSLKNPSLTPILPDVQERISLEQYCIRIFPFEGMSGWDNHAGGEYLQYPESIYQSMLDNLYVQRSKCLLDICRYPATALLQAEIYTKELLQENLNIRNTYLQKLNELRLNNFGENSYPYEIGQYAFSGENEFVKVRFIQLIDGIPLCCSQWSYEWHYHPLITFLYDSEGRLRRFEAVHTVQKQNVRKEVPIISPQTAMNTFIADYASAIHFNTTIVYDLKLEYVLLGDRNIGLRLRPVWNLYTKSVVDPLPSDVDWGRDWSVFEYKSILISADTGVILTDLLDAR